MTRGEPQLRELDEHHVHADPIRQFQEWYDEAIAAGIPQCDAMTLATASADGVPSARIVLLKKADENGFVFYTNYQSRKGRELDSNPRAALVFFWAGHNRSVRIEGTVGRVSASESGAYFATRPRDGQLSSLTSNQSDEVGNRATLDETFDALKKRFEGKPIPRPDYWGGYRLKPARIEFWQARFARLNDRVEYTLQPDGLWKKRRLQP